MITGRQNVKFSGSNSVTLTGTTPQTSDVVDATGWGKFIFCITTDGSASHDAVATTGVLLPCDSQGNNTLTDGTPFDNLSIATSAAAKVNYLPLLRTEGGLSIVLDATEQAACLDYFKLKLTGGDADKTVACTVQMVGEIL